MVKDARVSHSCSTVAILSLFNDDLFILSKEIILVFFGHENHFNDKFEFVRIT